MEWVAGLILLALLGLVFYTPFALLGQHMKAHHRSHVGVQAANREPHDHRWDTLWEDGWHCGICRELRGP